MRDLEILSTLGRRKHFGRAAEECGMSQPAFSMRLRKMEDRLGTQLVKRGNRFQGFTPEGDTLVKHARRIMDDFKVMEQELRSAKGEISGSLNLGVIPTAMVFAARAAKMLQAKHPGIKVSLHNASSLEVQKGLEDGVFDAGFTYSEGVIRNIFIADPVYEESYLLLSPDSLAPRSTGAATWTEAAELPLSLLVPGMQNRQIIDGIFAEIGVEPHVIAESSGFVASTILATEGAAATIIPRQMTDAFGPLPHTVMLDLIEPTITKDVSLVSLSRDQNLQTVNALRLMVGKSS